MKRYFAFLYLLFLLASNVLAQSYKSNMLFAKAMDEYGKRNYTEAIRLFMEVDSIDKADESLSDERKGYGESWAAYCYYLLGDSVTANNICPYTYNLMAVDRRLTVKSDSLSYLGRCFGAEGDYEQALRYLKECAEEEGRNLGKTHIYRANSLQQVGYLYEALGQSENVIQALEQANEIYRKHGYLPGMVMNLPSLEQAYSAVNQFDKYQSLLDEVLPQAWLKIDTLSNTFNAQLYLTLMEVCCNIYDWASVTNLASVAMNMYKNLGLTDDQNYYYMMQRAVMGFYMADIGPIHDVSELLLELEQKFKADSNAVYNTIARFHKVRCEKGNVPADVTIRQAKEMLERMKSQMSEESDFYVEGLLLLFDSYETSASDVEQLVEQLRSLLSVQYVTFSTQAKIRQRLGSYYAFTGQADLAMRMFEENKETIMPYAANNSMAYYLLVNNAIALASSVTQNAKMDAVMSHLNEIKSLYERNARAYGMTEIRDYMYYRLLASMAIGYGTLGNMEMRYKMSKQIADAYGTLHYDTFSYDLAKAYLNADMIQFGGEEQTEDQDFYSHNRAWTDNDSGVLWGYMLQAFGKQDWDLCLAVQDTMLNVCSRYGKTSTPYLTVKVMCMYIRVAAICKDKEEYQECYNELNAIRKDIERNFDKKTNVYRYFLGAYMACHYRLGMINETMELAQEFHDIVMSDIKENFQNMTYEERTAFWNNNNGWFLRDLPILLKYVDDSRMVEYAYDAIMLGKGILLNSDIEVRRQLIESGDTISLRMSHELDALRQELRLAITQPSLGESVVDSLRREVGLKERDLMAQNRSYGDYTQALMVSWRDILKCLDDHEAAVEIVFVPDGEEAMYGALVLSKDTGRPVWLPLFDVSELLFINQNDCYTTSQLSDLIWKKIEQVLPDCKRIFFSATGMLHNIAIEHMPMDDGCIAAERYELFRVSSTRELLNRSKQRHEWYNALLYGDLDYWGDDSAHMLVSERSPLSNETNTKRGVAGCDGTIAPVEPLYYTRVEIDSIAKILSDNNIASKCLTRSDGDEASIKSLTADNSFDVMHIATHGLYKPESQNEFVVSLDAMGMDTKRNASLMEDLQLMCSGLAMAKANKALAGEQLEEGEEDGLLTALEISRIDLRNTDLVVLSACETALGAINGDGVFGLQRGFKKAGVRSLMMSLWSVDDEATQILMTQFYRNYVLGMTKQKSLSAAQTYLRKYQNGKYDSPEYWAAFILLDAMD